MDRKLVLKVLAVSLVVVMIASSVALYSSTNMEEGIDEGGGKGVIFLVSPSFISTARAAGGEVRR